MANIRLISMKKFFEEEDVLKSIDLEIENGEIISLLGPSGCGKTTTLKLIAGLLSPDGGDIEFDGKSVLDVSPEKRGAIIVFQDHLLFPHMTVEKNVEFGLKMAKKDKEYRCEKVREMLELVKLDGFEKKYPSEISGGQKQRVAIARALAVEPRVLLLDEPFSNLDRKLKEEMRELISKIQKKLGITTVLVTHDKEDAMAMSDKIAIMMGGNILQIGTPAELYESPNSPEVASFFGDTNYLHGIESDGAVVTELGTFEADGVKGRLKVMFRPEDLKLLPKGSGEADGTVRERRYAGDKIYYSVGIGDLEFKCTADKSSGFEIGEEISLILDRERVRVYEW